jgi:aspartate aminotransferase
LHEAGIVVVPGEPFGTQEHIRFSYAVSHKDVDEGLERLRAFVAKL